MNAKRINIHKSGAIKPTFIFTDVPVYTDIDKLSVSQCKDLYIVGDCVVCFKDIRFVSISKEYIHLVGYNAIKTKKMQQNEKVDIYINL